MKKIILLILIPLFAMVESSVACNVCGCGVGNYHYGILPQFGKNFVGVRYRYSSYTSTLDASHGHQYSYETFQTTELWGRFYPARRVQAFVFVPVNFNERREGMHAKHLRGLGDIVISANYNLINTYDSADAKVKHNLLLGGGLKLPTGKYRALENGLTVNQNFQLGTGSVDFLFNLIYTIRFGDIGFNAEASYSLTTANKDEYQFGNATRTGLTAFYLVRAGAFTIMPNIGASAEFFEDNSQFDQPFQDTGGWASLYNLGTEVYYRNIALGATVAIPGKQALFNDMVEADNRFSAHLTYMF